MPLSWAKTKVVIDLKIIPSASKIEGETVDNSNKCGVCLMLLLNKEVNDWKLRIWKLCTLCP